MKNKIVWVLLVASLGFNAYFVVKALKGETVEVVQNTGEEVVIETKAEEKTASNVKEPIERPSESRALDVIEDENRQLKKKLSELEHELSQRSKPKASDVKFTTSTDSEASKELGRKSKAVMERFEVEAVDYTWSNETQNKLDQLFVESALTSEVQVKGMTCKTTICKVSITPYSGSSQGSLMGAGMDFLKVVRTSEQSSIANMQTVFSLEADSEQVDIFLYKDN